MYGTELILTPFSSPFDIMVPLHLIMWGWGMGGGGVVWGGEP